eukprot:TRINITY_DN65231_c0_g1_i1.p1 TRINITY_DN65231_c0_g1~~TRINITY_DN65231_c0_g1_i1.p1  ORF type:complete len:884 (-),score=128.84 TRINITY_DN65231_c0_g1_i1:83-2734(-)
MSDNASSAWHDVGAAPVAESSGRPSTTLSFLQRRFSNASMLSVSQARNSRHTAPQIFMDEQATTPNRRPSACLHPANFTPLRQSDMQDDLRRKTTPCSSQVKVEAVSVNGNVEFGYVIRLLNRLLLAHEVKFTLQLLEHLSGSSISRRAVSVGVSEFAHHLESFLDSRYEGQKSSGSPVNLVQTAIVGLRAQPQMRSSEESKQEHPADDCQSRKYEVASPRRCEEGSQISARSSPQASPLRRPEVRRDLEASTPRRAEDDVQKSGTFKEFDIHEGLTLPENLGEIPSQDDSIDIVNSESALSKGSDEIKTVLSHGSLGARTELLSRRLSSTQALSFDKHVDLDMIDLDDVSVEQANFLATPSDRFIVHPNTKIRVAWDLFVLVLIIVECVTLPLTLSFEISLPAVVHILSLVCFSIDMILSFTTGYYHGSLLIMKRKRITQNYLRTWFVLEFASLFPWEDVFALFAMDEVLADDDGRGQQTTFLRVLKLGKLMRVLRLLRLAKISALIKRLQSNGILPVNLMHLKFGMSVTKMFFVFGFLSHWAACFWGWLGDPEFFGSTSTLEEPYDIETCTMGGPCEPGIQGSPWRQRYGLNNYDSATEYLAALQFAAALITGGESPMQASHPVERLFAIIVMICSMFVSSVVVGEILLVMNRQNEARMAHDERMQQARDFMNARRIPMTMQVRVYAYLETQHNIQHGHSASNRKFMACLSDQLQTEMVEYLNTGLVIQHPFFNKLKNKIALQRLCLEACPVIFAANDVIVEKGKLATCAHFIVHGKVRVQSPLVASGKVLYLKPPSWLGDICLFMDTLRMNTVTAVVMTETLCLHKSSLLNVCDDFPDVRLSYNAFRDTIKDDNWDNLRCHICGDIGHHADVCPRLSLSH